MKDIQPYPSLLNLDLYLIVTLFDPVFKYILGRRRYSPFTSGFAVCPLMKSSYIYWQSKSTWSIFGKETNSNEISVNPEKY